MLDKLSISQKLQYGKDCIELEEIRECNGKDIVQYIFYSTKFYNSQNGKRKQYEIIKDFTSQDITLLEEVVDIEDKSEQLQQILFENNIYEFFTEINYKVDVALAKDSNNLLGNENLIYAVYINNKDENDVLLKVNIPNKEVLYYINKDFKVQDFKLKSKSKINSFLVVFWILILIVVIFVAIYLFMPDLLIVIKNILV